ncbi:hypothetical protein PYW08_008624 [Mythimna loreyi]|uniref:Uncharacterized protein n=1 Tax=Mythimna loreyi TaxID=667449 RepID=A0ACC2Q9X4_9NEOP|nr:hypothetical protein PYW08_008624 [Mythimna loreyi]
MRPLVIAFGLLVVAAYSNMANIDTSGNNQFVVKPIIAATNRDLENDDNSLESFTSFIEEKLMHQNQALEHLIKSVDKTGDMIKKLIDNLSRGLEKPTMPTKAEVDEPSQVKRRHNSNNRDNSKDNPVLRLGKNIPKYGKLAKDLMFKDNSGTDPTPLIEENINLPLLQPGSRRSSGDDPVHSPSQQSDDNKVNPWCPMALLCQKIEDPVCGFDDEFGYGRFENFCHLLRVNCYWKYNFSVVNSCRPKL